MQKETLSLTRALPSAPTSPACAPVAPAPPLLLPWHCRAAQSRWRPNLTYVPADIRKAGVTPQGLRPPLAAARWRGVPSRCPDRQDIQAILQDRMGDNPPILWQRGPRVERRAFRTHFWWAPPPVD